MKQTNKQHLSRPFTFFGVTVFVFWISKLGQLDYPNEALNKKCVNDIFVISELAISYGGKDDVILIEVLRVFISLQM